MPGSVGYPCRGCTDPAPCLCAGEWDGGEWPVRICLRVSVQRAGVAGGGSAGPADAGLLPHEEPQLRQGHREGLLPGRRVHIAAVLISPAYNHHGEDHPEQYWWVTQGESQRGNRKGRYIEYISIRSSFSLPDAKPLRESAFCQGAGQTNQPPTTHRQRLMQLWLLLCSS